MEKNEKLSNRITQVIEILLTVGILVVCVLMLAGFKLESGGGTDTGRCYEMNDGWTVVTSKGRLENVSLPYSVREKQNFDVYIERILPDDLTDRDWVQTRAFKENMWIYINGELRGSWVQSEDGVYRVGIASVNIYAPVTSEDAGKIIRIYVSRPDGNLYSFGDFQYGYKTDIIHGILRKNLTSAVLAFVFLILGFICFLGGLFMRITTHNELQADFAGLTMLIIAIWNITQSSYRDLLFADVKTISIVPAICLAFLPIPFAMYFNNLQKRRYEKAYFTYCFLMFIYVLVWTILQIFRISDFYYGLKLTFILEFAMVGIIIGTIIQDRKKGFSKEYRVISIGCMILTVAGFGQAMVFTFDAFNPDGSLFTAGFAAFVLTCVIYSARTVLHMDTDRKAALLFAETKTRFLATMSHEIRTPLNAVLGFNEVILNETTEDNIKRYAEDVDKAGRLLLSLINDILDTTRLETGKMKLVIGEYSLSGLISSGLNMIEKRATDKQLKVVLDCDEKLPEKLRGDDVRVLQSVTNLLTNAIKYTDEGSVTLKVSGICEADKLWLRFDVKDTGISIKKEDQVHLFEAFERVDLQKNKNVEGSGLGLNITYQLVKLMGGTIDVKSEYGKGSVFTIIIPQEIVNGRTIGDISLGAGSSGEIGNERFRKKKYQDCSILIVDDLQINVKVVESMLRKTGIVTESAYSGDECIEKCRDRRFDVILLDHMMPGKDGIETLMELKKLTNCPNHDTPVVVLTANVAVGAHEEYMEEGFDDYLSKPISMTDLQKILDKFVSNKTVGML